MTFKYVLLVLALYGLQSQSCERDHIWRTESLTLCYCLWNSNWTLFWWNGLVIKTHVFEEIWFMEESHNQFCSGFFFCFIYSIFLWNKNHKCPCFCHEWVSLCSRKTKFVSPFQNMSHEFSWLRMLCIEDSWCLSLERAFPKISRNDHCCCSISPSPMHGQKKHYAPPLSMPFNKGLRALVILPDKKYEYIKIYVIEFSQSLFRRSKSRQTQTNCESWSWMMFWSPCQLLQPVPRKGASSLTRLGWPLTKRQLKVEFCLLRKE